MSLTEIGIVGLALLLLFLAIGVPVGIAMIASGFVGIVFTSGVEGAFSMMQLIPFSTVASEKLVVLPLFLLMGEFAFHGGLSEESFYFMHKLFGHLPGGLAVATIGGCAAFAGVCGSSVATAVTMGTVALPEMRRYNTADSLASGVVAAGGTLGILIPPSIGFILYAITTEQSIGKLFLAGFLPGILLTVLFIITVFIMTSINPSLSPPAPRASLREQLTAGSRTWGIVLLFLLVLGGMYFGIFTPSEGAGIGAFGAFLLCLIKRRLTWRIFLNSILGAGKTTGVIFVIIIGGFIFGYFLTLTRIPNVLSALVTGLPVDRYIILILVLVFYVVLGCVMDVVAGMLVTLPVVFPVIQSLGFDPIWFGVLMVIVLEMGLISPPVGLNVFAISAVAKDIPIATIYLGILPFIGSLILCLILIILFPEIALFIPGMLK
jgi:C4-dicarboxylate transporter, DctM subunit